MVADKKRKSTVKNLIEENDKEVESPREKRAAKKSALNALLNEKEQEVKEVKKAKVKKTEEKKAEEKKKNKEAPKEDKKEPLTEAEEERIRKRKEKKERQRLKKAAGNNATDQEADSLTGRILALASDSKKRKVEEEVNQNNNKKKKLDPQLETILSEVRFKNCKATPYQLRKAINKATQEYYSKKKKGFNNAQLEFLTKKLSEKWCPRNCVWWDKECENSYNSVYLLAAMLGCNIEKEADKFLAECPEESDLHFQLLEKKKANHKNKIEETKIASDCFYSEKTDKVKRGYKTKSEKKMRKEINLRKEKYGNTKTEEEIIKEIIAEKEKTTRERQLKVLRNSLYLNPMDWFDEEIKALHSEIKEKAKQDEQDIDNSFKQLKLFKAKNRDLFKKYLELVASKKKLKKKKSKKEKTKEGKSETNTSVAGSKRNKKIVFEE